MERFDVTEICFFKNISKIQQTFSQTNQRKNKIQINKIINKKEVTIDAIEIHGILRDYGDYVK